MRTLTVNTQHYCALLYVTDNEVYVKWYAMEEHGLRELLRWDNDPELEDLLKMITNYSSLRGWTLTSY